MAIAISRVCSVARGPPSTCRSSIPTGAAHHASERSSADAPYRLSHARTRNGAVIALRFNIRWRLELPELWHTTCASRIVVSLNRGRTAFEMRRFQAKNWLGAMPARRAA